MKWFVVTNRDKISNSEFGEDPTWKGKIHFLSNTTDRMPRSNRQLKLNYIGDSKIKRAKKAFVDDIRKQLISMGKQLKQGAKPVLLLIVHGYNTNYDEAVESYVELRRNFHKSVGKNDFEKHCLPVLFTWPSEGTIV